MFTLDSLFSSSIFQFFYSIYDHFLQPQKKFHCLTLHSQDNDSWNNEGFKQLSRLFYATNQLTENPCRNEDEEAYLVKLEYRNFYLNDLLVSEYTSKRYIYQFQIRGSEGLVIFIVVGEDVEYVLRRRYDFSLLDILKLAKCDDSVTVPFGKEPPCKKSDFRPILFVIQEEKEEVIEKTRTMINEMIEEAEYEKENTLVVAHFEESNIYEGLEWIFKKTT